MRTAVVVTTYQRPACLARSLPQIVAAAKEVGADVIVVDDASPIPIRTELLRLGARFIFLPENRGLAAALNIGLSYWLADPSVEVIHYFQDDVEVDPLCIAACNAVLEEYESHLVTGHDAKEHRERSNRPVFVESCGVATQGRESCRATHMSATRESWMRVMPIRSRGVGLPSRKIRDAHNPAARGTGSGVDWWIVRDSPNKLPVLCIPGLVRTFAWRAAESCWDNEQIAGEDPPLSRASIAGWLKPSPRDGESTVIS